MIRELHNPQHGVPPVLIDPTPATLGVVYKDWPPGRYQVKSFVCHPVQKEPSSVVLCLELERHFQDDTEDGNAAHQTLHLQYEITDLVQLAQSLLRLLDPSLQEQILEQLKRL